jgi:flagellar biosynthesis protein FliR
MQIVVEMAWIQTVLLVALRLAATLVMTPVFAITGMTAHLRVFFVLALAVTLTSALAVPPVPVLSMADLVMAGMSEVVLGALLAFGLFTAFAAFQLAGRTMDLQMGFGVASLIDPATRTQSPLLGTLLNLIAVAVFFAVNGHHLLIRGLAFSLEHLPPGRPLGELNYAAVVAQFGGMFVFALALAAPVLIVLLLVDIAMAVVARTMPQVNVFIVSMPLKIIVGLFVLIASMHFMGPLMMRIFEALFDYWQQVIG